MTDSPIPDDIKAMSFEQALKALEDLVRSLEKGDASLEEAIHVYERGNYLRRQCTQRLKDAKMRIEKIQTQQGNITTTPLDNWFFIFLNKKNGW